MSLSLLIKHGILLIFENEMIMLNLRKLRMAMNSKVAFMCILRHLINKVSKLNTKAVNKLKYTPDVNIVLKY